MALTIDQKSSPIVVTGTASTSELITSKAIFIHSVYWYNPTTQGHLLSLTDGNGRAFAKANADVVNRGIEININCLFDSVYCDDMDSGTLFIYHR